MDLRLHWRGIRGVVLAEKRFDFFWRCLHCVYMKKLEVRSQKLCMGVSWVVMGRSPKFARAAFTLIELLVVVAVIAVLAGFTLAAMGGINQKAARDRSKAEVAAIANALERFKSQNDRYPAANGANLPYAAIRAFLPVSDSSLSTNGSVVVFNDPYGTPYLYRLPGSNNIATFDVWSAGQNSSATATNDDIGNW
jgi:general secretion pathway protein G